MVQISQMMMANGSPRLMVVTKERDLGLVVVQSGWNNNSKFYQGESSGSFKSYNPVECQICGKKGHSAVDRYQNLECTIYLS